MKKLIPSVETGQLQTSLAAYQILQSVLHAMTQVLQKLVEKGRNQFIFA